MSPRVLSKCWRVCSVPQKSRLCGLFCHLLLSFTPTNFSTAIFCAFMTHTCPARSPRLPQENWWSRTATQWRANIVLLIWAQWSSISHKPLRMTSLLAPLFSPHWLNVFSPTFSSFVLSMAPLPDATVAPVGKYQWEDVFLFAVVTISFRGSYPFLFVALNVHWFHFSIVVVIYFMSNIHGYFDAQRLVPPCPAPVPRRLNFIILFHTSKNHIWSHFFYRLYAVFHKRNCDDTIDIIYCTGWWCLFSFGICRSNQNIYFSRA